MPKNLRFVSGSPANGKQVIVGWVVGVRGLSEMQVLRLRGAI
jgi:hypothetical protein